MTTLVSGSPLVQNGGKLVGAGTHVLIGDPTTGYGIFMINLSPSNEKLKRRVIRIVREIRHCSEEDAISRLEAHSWNIRAAVE